MEWSHIEAYLRTLLRMLDRNKNCTSAPKTPKTDRNEATPDPKLQQSK